ncbi:MAG TPA: ABC transporter substrate-binding protein [Terriglobales bacterium]|nr:ABC transporter substrate-binding protein [Terriglobales bacterium]
MLAACNAQQVTTIPRIGFVAPQGRTLPLFDAFKQGLADAGYFEGRNITIEARFAEGQYERLPAIFDELTRDKVDLLAVTGAVTARAAKKAVPDVPIVFAVVVDPVADKVIANYDHPGGNLTGVTSFDPQQARKQFELLREVIPTIKRVAVLGDQGVSEVLITAADEQARVMGLQPQRIRLAGPNPDLVAAFAQMKQEHADALLVLEEPVLGVHANEIAELATKDRLPSIFAPSRVGAGGLISFGVSQTEAIRHMASYIDKILKGAKPGDLPVEKIDRYELIVNLKTAHAIGVMVPAEVLKRANRVIEDK